MKKPETLTILGFEKRIFPKTKKQVDIKFEETPLFKASIEAEIEAKQLKLFNSETK